MPKDFETIKYKALKYFIELSSHWLYDKEGNWGCDGWAIWKRKRLNSKLIFRWINWKKIEICRPENAIIIYWISKIKRRRNINKKGIRIWIIKKKLYYWFGKQWY